MVTIEKHKLVFAADYEDPLSKEYLYHVLLRVYDQNLKVLCCEYIPPQPIPLSLFRSLYQRCKDKVLLVRESEDRANEVS